MPSLNIESSTTVMLQGGSNTSYLTARNLGAATKMNLNTASLQCGQYKQVSSYVWNVLRDGVIFDLSGLPSDAEVTAATLKIYVSSDSSDTDFLISVSEAHLSTPPTYSDYSKFDGPLGSFGTLTTAGIGVGAFNSIVFNSTGIAYVNAAIQVGEVEVGLRSMNDLLSTAPTQSEFVNLLGQSHANRPVLELTYSELSSGEYPDAPVFAATGKIELDTYSTISSYLTALDVDLSLIADTDGNVALDEANWITWDTTSEKIAYDAAGSNVTVTTYGVTTLTLAGDFVTADLTMNNDSSAVDCTVANDAQLSDTAYATIQSKVTDNEVVFSGVGAQVPADDEGDIYMDSTSGDLILKTRDDGQAGVKTDILADFSAL